MEGIPAPDVADYKRRKEQELGLPAGSISGSGKGLPQNKRPRIENRVLSEDELRAQLQAHKALMGGGDAAPAPAQAHGGAVYNAAPQTYVTPPVPPPIPPFPPGMMAPPGVGFPGGPPPGFPGQPPFPPFPPGAGFPPGYVRNFVCPYRRIMLSYSLCVGLLLQGFPSLHPAFCAPGRALYLPVLLFLRFLQGVAHRWHLAAPHRHQVSVPPHLYLNLVRLLPLIHPPPSPPPELEMTFPPSRKLQLSLRPHRHPVRARHFRPIRLKAIRR